MGLFERLTEERSSGLPAHQFAAAVDEVSTGNKTQADVATAFGLSSAEQGELDTLMSRIGTQTGRVTPAKFHHLLLLAHNRLLYRNAAELKTRLGV